MYGFSALLLAMPATVAKLIENIRHYCRKIERHPNDKAPLLRYGPDSRTRG